MLFGMVWVSRNNGFSIILIRRRLQYLKVQSCKLYNSKYMIASMQVKNTENFTFNFVYKQKRQ